MLATEVERKQALVKSKEQTIEELRAIIDEKNKSQEDFEQLELQL